VEKRVEQGLLQVLMLLGAAVATINVCQRLHIPTSLAYLLVGVLLGPFTLGPVVDAGAIRLFAEFGIVFLLFTIGLNYSLPQLQALRSQVLWLGTAQVGLTTLLVAVVAWLAGASPVAAFVIGAIFAQSSTTIISKQLSEQSEENSPHGRLGTAMSVFQDVTAVPFLVVIPVLGAATGAAVVATLLGTALAKAALATALVLVAGRFLLKPLFHAVALQRSAEVFTLTVLLVSLGAAWITNSLGLSLAFGAFLAGMVLGETEFRHQVEATIRPFRDVLLGLFFVGIGMLFDPGALPEVWAWALAGTALLLVSKALLVAGLVRRTGMSVESAWRTGLIVCVGGEFGLALLAIALANGAIDAFQSQVTITAVLFSFVIATFLIRFNGPIARLLTPKRLENNAEVPEVRIAAQDADNHVIICGYGRVGQNVGHSLELEGISYLAVDLDPSRVRQARLAGEPVYYGDATDPAMLEAIGVDRARLMVLSNDDTSASLRILHHVRSRRPDLPVMVRTRDEAQGDKLRAAGASEIVPETLEASLMIATHVLERLDVPAARVQQLVQKQRETHYAMLRGHFPGEVGNGQADDQLEPIVIGMDSPCRGRSLGDLGFVQGNVTALVRNGERQLDPPLETVVEPGDTVVLRGPGESLAKGRNRLLRA